MLIEELFRRGIMMMGPAQNDPARFVGTLNMELLATFPPLKAAEMQKMRWLEGDGTLRNRPSNLSRQWHCSLEGGTLNEMNEFGSGKRGDEQDASAELL